VPATLDAVLRLYNTLTKRVEPFEPRQAGHVGMYTCGPTVYREVHLGNLRSYLLADWLRRVLATIERYDVTHVKNITDVGHMRQDLLDRGEDKVIAAALSEGKTAQQIAERYASLFRRDEDRLNILPAHVFPKATEHVDEMIQLTERLVRSGHAYVVDGTAYFSIRSFPEYGKLSGNIQEALRQGVRAEVDPAKRDAADFALWKSAEPGRVLTWPSPWGDGFPGWHIECSAMSTKYLGERFDLHTGGVDNIFPHHEGEIAQSESVFGGPFVGTWVHGQHLLADGVKMAKSAGNYYTLDDVVRFGFDPLAFRYQCLLTHYRTRMNFTVGALRQATEGLDHLRQRVRHYAQLHADADAEVPADWRERFKESLRSDLGLPSALAGLETALASDRSPRAKLAFALECDEVFGLRLADVADEHEALERRERQRLADHVAARSRRDYSVSDELRSVPGYAVEDHRAGVLVARREVRLGRRPRRTISSPKELPDGARIPASREWSVCIVTRDWPTDLERCLDSVLQRLPPDSEIVVLDDGSTGDAAERLGRFARGDRRLRRLFADRPLGEGRARNAVQRAARGRLALHLDPSVELVGDLFGPLGSVLEDPGVGLAGPWGLRSADLDHFDEATGGDVDAVQGYCFAARRETISALGGFDERYRFYRNLDIALSFAARERGLRAVAAGADAVIRHEHRAWEALQPEEREKRSRKNFDRFLHRFRHRTDLLVGAR
jgi:cysteinyl-tRNA synthetase